MGAKTLLSLEEFMVLPDDGNKHELSRGELVVMPPGKAEHALIINRINRMLSAYVYERGIGNVLSEAAYLLSREENTIRQPDVSFLISSRVKTTPPDDCCAGSPELAVDVVSPGNDADELELKINQYLIYGSKEVWVVYPRTRAVYIYRPGGTAQKLSDRDIITSDLFPGFSARFADFFDLDY
jgi:Uma2 family endonuclease